jgi:signal transduction histidine kinase
VLKADGSTADIELSATPIANDGTIVGIQGIARDITEKKLASEEIRHAKEELENRVAERTAELSQSNWRLEEEIIERKEAEKHLTATNSLLKLFCGTFRRKGYLEAVAKLLKTQCECDCVGIRLIDEQGNIPYIASSGFSSDFLEEEGCIALGKDTCVCTRIAREEPGRAEADLITPAGSFICNDMPRLQDPSKRGRSVKYRSACLRQGFGSVAVIAIRYRDKMLGVIHLADRRQEKFSRQIVAFVEAATHLIGEAIHRFSIEEALVASHKQLRNLSSHLVTAREDERLRVAREIHDELGQTLTAAGMELAMLKKDRDMPALAKQKISSVLGLIDDSIEDIQRICTELRPRILDHLGLKAAIEWQTKKFAERGKFSCFLDLPHTHLSLPSSVATSVFRIFQETLTNIARHAKAANVRIRLGIEDTVMLLEIHDDGKGIPRHRISGKDSFGIIGIRERVHQLGGKVTFKGVRNKGTTVTVTIPLNKGVPDV